MLRENKICDLGELLERDVEEFKERKETWVESLARIQTGTGLLTLGLRTRRINDGFSWQNSDFYENIEVLKMRGLIITDFWVYCVLTSFWNSDQEACFPSYKAIAKRACISVRTAMRSVKRLEQAGLIIVQRRPWKSNKYFFPKIEGIL